MNYGFNQPSQVEIEVRVVQETDMAYLFDYGGKEQVWIPKSQITDSCEDSDGKLTSIFIPEWLAVEKGMV